MLSNEVETVDPIKKCRPPPLPMPLPPPVPGDTRYHFKRLLTIRFPLHKPLACTDIRYQHRYKFQVPVVSDQRILY
jgi:hypothetical protein